MTSGPGPGECARTRILLFGGALLIIAAGLSPDLRHVILYNVLPLLSAYLITRTIASRLPERLDVVLIASISLLIHAYAFSTQEIGIEPDGIGYMKSGMDFAQGRGFPGMLFRPPLYPFLLGMTFLLAPGTPLIIIAVQHAAAVLVAVLTLRLAGDLSLPRATALLSSMLVGMNSLALQSSQAVLTETFYSLLVVASALCLVRLYTDLRPRWAILTGAIFVTAAHVKDILNPFLVIGLVLLVVTRGKRAVRAAACCAGVFALGVLPWSLRNLREHGTFALSRALGLNLMTKVTSSGLENQESPHYREISATLDNIKTELGIGDSRLPPLAPEDAWQVNRIPHVLVDSLTIRRGLRQAQADRLLVQVAVESISKRPSVYLKSIVVTITTLLFAHREMYPEVEWVFPLSRKWRDKAPGRLLRGLIYIPGWILVCFPLFFVTKRRRNLGQLLPWTVVIYGYGITAAVQVGFTRYTVPWIPFAAICCAQVLQMSTDGIRSLVAVRDAAPGQASEPPAGPPQAGLGEDGEWKPYRLGNQQNTA